MDSKRSGKRVAAAGIIGFLVGTLVRVPPSTTLADDAERKGAGPTAAAAPGDKGEPRAKIDVTADGPLGGRISFATRGADGVLTEKMRLSKDGGLAVGARIPPGYPRGGTPGNMNVIINDPSRPGAIIMMNEHEAVRGVGCTVCWGASDEWQVFLISSWLGETRRVAQTHNRTLPSGYLSSDYPGPTSAARMEIGMRVHDWVSLAATFEPIADDGRAFVTADREHPYLGQVQYLPPGGEWINNRRIGRHALMVGTTHTTGATAGGVVLAGDSYHEYPGKGPVVKSPNGTAYRIVVDDDGNLSTKKF